MKMEKEIKLVSTPEGRGKLFSLPLIRERILPGTEKIVELQNVYYDTPDMALTKAGLAYRIRQTNGKQWEVTIKTKGTTYNGVSQREEYTVPVTQPVPLWNGFSPEMDAKLYALLEGKSWEPFCIVAFTRHLALLDLGKGTQAELALDSGTIQAGENVEPLAEVELECKAGNMDAITAFVAKLQAMLPLQPENRSKLARGLALLDNPKNKSQKSEK